MSTRRIALLACGILIAAAAIFLVVRGFSGAPAAGDAPAGPTASEGRGGHGKAEEKAPRWQSFVRPGDPGTPPRPGVRLARGLASPFDRLATGGGGGAPPPPPVNPGLRLEGISQGDRPVALLSGHAVRVGDTLSGFRVTRIDRAAVTLAGPRGARLGLTLGGGR
jgi:hypothetical protein